MDTVTVTRKIMTYKLNRGLILGIQDMGKEVGLVVGFMVGYVVGC